MRRWVRLECVKENLSESGVQGRSLSPNKMSSLNKILQVGLVAGPGHCNVQRLNIVWVIIWFHFGHWTDIDLDIEFWSRIQAIFLEGVAFNQCTRKARASPFLSQTIKQSEKKISFKIYPTADQVLPVQKFWTKFFFECAIVLFASLNNQTKFYTKFLKYLFLICSSLCL